MGDMSTAKINNIIRGKITPVLNGLQSRDGLDVVDINACLLGLVTCSLQNILGQEGARDYIESAMDNVWGKKPKKRWWRK